MLFPTIEYSLGPKRSLGAYMKYSPIVSGTTLTALSNAEMAFGAEYSFWVASFSHFMKITFDISSLNLSLGFGQSSVTTYNLGLGYAF